ncbi:caspase-1-A-like [Rhinoraja longicauda]
MEAADMKLKRLRSALVNGLSMAVIKDLVDEMLETRVINPSESEEILQGNITTKDKARCLVDIVSRKGRGASEKLIQSLNKADTELCKELCLSPMENIVTSVPPTPPAAVIPTTAEWVTPCPQQQYNELSQKAEVYKMFPKHNRKRLALMINNIKFENPAVDRSGAEVDEIQMQKLLNGFGYEVKKHNNLTAEGIEKALVAFSNREEHMQSDSTFVVLMSHGLRDKICGSLHSESKEDLFHIDQAFDILNNKNCKGLRGKPKVVIIQACRGRSTGQVYVSDSVAPEESHADYEEDVTLYKLHKETDFICFCSTTPECVALRNVEKGSIFIEKLIDILRQNACKDHIEELFMQVQQSFQNFTRQMPARERATLMKKFYLFPGF